MCAVTIGLSYSCRDHLALTVSSVSREQAQREEMKGKLFETLKQKEEEKVCLMFAMTF